MFPLAHEPRDHIEFTTTILRQVRTYDAALAEAKRLHNKEQEMLHRRTLDARAGWRRSTATPSPPNQPHKRLKFDVEEFRRGHFKVRGNPSALDLLPYMDKIRAATFDPMHLVLIGLMKIFCKEIYVEGHYGGTSETIAKPKKVSKAERKRAEATNQQLLNNSLGLDCAPSEEELINLQRILETDSSHQEQEDTMKRKELYAVFRSDDIHELTRMMNEVGSDGKPPNNLWSDRCVSF